MQEIKCPKCGEVFRVDESGYAAIVKQVRDKEFSKEIHEREERLEKEKDSAVKIAKAETAEGLKDEIAAKTAEISELKAKLDAEENKRKLAVNEALAEKERELSEQREKIILLNGQLETSEKSSKLKEQTIKESYEEKLKDKDEQIAYYKDLKGV